MERWLSRPIWVCFWIVLSLFGTLPLLITDAINNLSFSSAFFESMSGLTTTGATVLSQLDDLPKSILFYRQQLQWLGGMGIIVLATIVFSRLFGGGIQVLQAEMPGTGITRLRPQMAQTARLLWSIYFFMTLVEISLLTLLSEMPLYDAICNSFSTVSSMFVFFSGCFSLGCISYNHAFLIKLSSVSYET